MYWIFLFLVKATHDGHDDWIHTFENSGVNYCEEITVNVVGTEDGVDHQEANEDFEFEGN